jgi:hypothetical protein
MAIKKTVKRYSGLADLKEQSIALFHLIQDDFPGINFGIETGFVSRKSKTEIQEDNPLTGKLRLDQNDGTPVPLAQILPILLAKNAEIIVQKNGTQVGQQRKVNFIEGSNVTLTIVNDPSNQRVNVTINAASTGGTGAMTYTEASDLSFTVTKNSSSLRTLTFSPATNNLLLGFLKVVGEGDAANLCYDFDLEMYEDSGATKLIYKAVKLNATKRPYGLIDNFVGVFKLTSSRIYPKVYNNSENDVDFDIVVRGIVLS